MTAHTADEIIEAMARIIFVNRMKGTDDWDRAMKRAAEFEGNPYDSPNIKAALMDARAAYAECLRRLREPTQDQELVGKYVDPGYEDGNASADIHWTAMIDSRLKELG